MMNHTPVQFRRDSRREQERSRIRFSSHGAFLHEEMNENQHFRAVSCGHGAKIITHSPHSATSHHVISDTARKFQL